MKHTISYFLLFFLLGSLFCQSQSSVIPPNVQAKRSAWSLLPQAHLPEPSPAGSISETPVGSIQSDAVSAIKIGESSNAYSTIWPEMNQLSVDTSIGQNGGTIGFIYRENVASCGTASTDNSLYRYSLSTDGGLSWQVGAGINTGGTFPVGGCYGLGPVNPNYVPSARHPNLAIFIPPDSSANLDNLGLVYTGTVLGPADLIDVSLGYTDSIAFDPPTIQQEIHLGGSYAKYPSYSLIERAAGEFFFLSYLATGLIDVSGDVYVHRGLWNPNTQQIDWAVVDTIFPEYFTGYDGLIKWGHLSIAFSPDGSVGYVAGTGDLVGGVDSAMTVWMSKSIDGGMNWGGPFAYDLRSYPDLMDSLHIWREVYPIMDPITGIFSFDTTFVGGNYPTVLRNLDLVVDENDVPHAITAIGHASIHNGDGTYSAPNYHMWSGDRVESYILDFTLDSFGDPNMLYLDRQNFLFGKAGAGSVTSGVAMQVSPFGQAARSADGELVFFSWTDSDAIADTANDHPNLLTIGYDVSNGVMTPTMDRTSDDSIWNGKVLTPHSSPLALDNGSDVYTLPISAMTMDGVNALEPVSHWYFPDTHFDRTNDFPAIPRYFYNCKQNPFSNTFHVSSPDCNVANGEIVIIPAGGIGPYAYQWSANVLGGVEDTASNLSAGLFEVIITDSKSCKDTLTIPLGSIGGPAGMVDSIQAVSCFGQTDGQASIVLAGASGAETYSWTNGETTPTAMSLAPGTHWCTVTDTLTACISFFTTTISEPSPVQLQISATDALCFGEPSGELSVIASGGTGNFQFAWGNGQAGNQLADIYAGTYLAIVTDENGCTATAYGTVDEPAALNANLSSFPNTASNAPYDGAILASIEGGTPPYVNHYASSAGFDTAGVNLEAVFGLCAGIYYLESTDGNGCILMDTIVVEANGVGVACLPNSMDALAGVKTFRLYPNPAEDEVIIELELERSAEIFLSLSDTRGRVLQERRRMFGLTDQEHLSLEHLSAGLYLIGLTSDEGTVVQKLMVR